MKLQVVSNFNLVNNEATSCFRAQTSQEWNYKLIPISNHRKWSYKLFWTSNGSGMKLQVVYKFNLVNNEATSCFRGAQTSQEWNYKLIPISNNRKWSYMLFPTSKESGMKVQVVSGLKRVRNETTSWFQFQTTENEATSCFQLQTSLEWCYKLFPTSIYSIMKL